MPGLNLGSIRADFSNWMASDYFTAAAAAGAGIFVSEMLTKTALNLSGWTGTKASLLKVGVRLGMSALYYWLGKKYGKPELGLTASVGPVAITVAELIAGILKMTPDQAGAALAARLGGWRRVATASAGATTIRVVSAPSPQPAAATAVARVPVKG